MSTYPYFVNVGSMVLDVSIPMSDIQVDSDLLKEGHPLASWINFFAKISKKFPRYSNKFKLCCNAIYTFRSLQKERGTVENIYLSSTFSNERRLSFTILFATINDKETFLWLITQRFGNVLLSNY